MIIEICANSFASAKAAQDAGADRIELCTQLSVGGLTPSHGLIKKVISELNIETHVLIRPRSGNFTYSTDELDVMAKDIAYCKEIGCAGVVTGILTPQNNIDTETTQKLVEIAKGIDFTFHRAFDWTQKPLEAISKLQQMGVTRILSSGQQPKAIDGIGLLKQLKKVSGNTLQLMPGSGINAQNILAFKEAGFQMVHFSATEKRQVLSQKPIVSMHSDSFFEEGILAVSNKDKIIEIIKLVSCFL